MVVAALLDLGADERVLCAALKSLHVPGFEIAVKRVNKAGIDACDFEVTLQEEYDNHDHDMEYLFGEHMHEQEHEHAHTHTDIHTHAHAHVHRGLQEILEIIEKADLTDGARKKAKEIFDILAQGEAKAHGVDKEHVHFHEVGAVDSIVDIVAAAVCIDNLGIEEVIVPVLYEGTGFVRCQHGMMPIPVPAVAAIAKDRALPLHITKRQAELVTPTGAAIAAALRTAGDLPGTFHVKKVGIGAGKRTYEIPSLLRAMILETESEEPYDKDVIYKLETNIDDCTGEALGYVMERLFEAGARDVHYIPSFMKKNRPAYQLNVICTQEDIPKLEEIIFAETSTIGIRRQRMERTILKRETREIDTPLGTAKVKVCKLGDVTRGYPEYESVTELCHRHGKSYQEVYQLIARAYDGSLQ